MDYGDFKVLCVLNGVEPDIVDAVRSFVKNEINHLPSRWNNSERFERSDLGFAELSDITTLEAGLKEIKDSIFYSTVDFDKMGRNITKMRMRQLIKDPGKHISRVILKTYYLANGQVF